MTKEEANFLVEMQTERREKLNRIIDDMRNLLREAEAERDSHKSRAEMLEKAIKSHYADSPRDNAACFMCKSVKKCKAECGVGFPEWQFNEKQFKK